MMKISEAKAECERWFAHLDRQREKTKAMQQLAADRRNGLCDTIECRRRLRALDGPGVTVYDGAKLERAVKVLLKNVKEPLSERAG
jgi:hypothetical protein